MNKQIENYYMAHINDQSPSELFLREALVTAIRCDNPQLAEVVLKRLPELKSSDFYDCSSPVDFALKEMASVEVIRVLFDNGFSFSRMELEINPFNGTPEELLSIKKKTSDKSEKDIYVDLISAVAYFINVISTNYSCYRIPYNVYADEKFRPCFLSYLDDWLSCFIKLAVDKSEAGNTDYLVKAIIKNIAFKKAVRTCIEVLPGECFSEDNLKWFINVAASSDNSYGFDLLLEHYPQSISFIDSYPVKNQEILSEIFEHGMLKPGSEEGYKAFISYISFEEVDEKILNQIVHPSYLKRTDKYGCTPLMSAVRNENYPPELYRYLISSPEDINAKDNHGRAAIFYLANSDYPECIEELIELGADVNITDSEGNNVVHILFKGSRTSSVQHLIRDCSFYLPVSLLNMKNSNGETPFDVLYRKMRGDI